MHRHPRDRHHLHRPVRRYRQPPAEHGAGMNGGDPAGNRNPQHARFIRMPASDSPDAQQRVMSWSAHDLQLRATTHSAASGQPGFVPDGYLENLNDLGFQPTITADELCSVGMWERTGGGYRILDREAIQD